MSRSRNDDEHEGEASSRFAQAMARQGGRPVKVVDFPGLDGERVGVWCPNAQEETEAEVAARKHLTGHYKMSALDLSLTSETELYQRERDVEMLTLVLRDPDEPNDAFFESSDEARGLTRPQVRALLALVEDFRRERYEARTPENAAELVRLVRESKAVGALSTWLTSCDAGTLRELVELLANDTPPTTDTRSTPPSSSTS